MLLTGLALHFIIPERAESQMENRKLTVAADIAPTAAGIFTGEWSAQVESYISDQFPRRDSWMRKYVQFQMLTGKTYLNDKYYADNKTGWIVSKPAEAKPKAELDSFVNELVNMDEVLKEAHIPFYFYSLPTKATYVRKPSPAFMPEDAGVQNNAYVHEQLTKLGVANSKLKDAMPEAVEVSTYFKTDHHWNMQGAYAGYEALITTLSEKMAVAMKPVAYNPANTQCLPNDFAGSWNKILYMMVKNDDRVCYNSLPNMANNFIIYDGDEQSRIADFSEVYARLVNLPANTQGNYATAYSADYPELTYVNKAKNNGKHIVIIKDSYFNPIQFHVASHFAKTTILDLRYLEKDVPQYIMALQPDAVVLAYSDRNFNVFLEQD